MAKLTFSWTTRPANENISEYRVYEDAPCERKLFVTVPAKNLAPSSPASVLLPDVAQGSRTFRIAAVNSSGEGLFSQPISVNVLPPAGTPGITDGFGASVSFLP